MMDVGGRLWREGISVYLWLIDVVAQEKPTKCCKEIILQLKFFLNSKKCLGSFKKLSCKYLPKYVIS